MCVAGGHEEILGDPVNSRPLEEVWQRYKEGPHSHQQAANCNEPWTMELGAKVADKSNDHQVAWRRGDKKFQLICYPLKGTCFTEACLFTFCDSVCRGFLEMWKLISEKGHF